MAHEGKVLLAKNAAGDLSPAEAARVLERAVADAGALALSMLEAGVRVWNKKHDSPVSEADMAVDALLRERLHAAAPGYGWQSEESADAPGRPAQRRRWVVDPIDGTRSFIKKLPDWSIAVALVEDGRPIAAAIHAPASGELYLATAGGGATLNGARIAASKQDCLAAAKLAGPRATLAGLQEAGFAFEAVPRIHSLALRFARVAGGAIDAAIASERSRDWDIAAADLLLQEAGAALTTQAGERLVYDRPEAEHPALAASGPGLRPALLAALRRISVGPGPAAAKAAQP